MTCSCGYLSTSIGKKFLMALTGLGWSLFVMVHMLGNLLLFVSAEAYNRYSHALISNPFIYVAEAGLVALLLIHVVTAIQLRIRNRRAKPKFYQVSPVRLKSASLSSRTMIYTGSLMLAFIIWHLVTFKWGPHYAVVYDGVEMRDLHKLIVEKFADPFYVASYCVVMLLIGTHLFHGIKSSFQTLGINHPRYNEFIKYFGYTYAIVVGLGFFVQPLYVYLMG